MKKKAIKIGVFFLILIVVCIFVSRTLATVRTPKAEFVMPNYMTIAREYTLSGKMELPDAEDIYLSDAIDYPMTIKAVHVRPGDTVAVGDVLFDVEVFQGEKKLDDSYMTLDKLLTSKLKLKETMLKKGFDFDSNSSKFIFNYVTVERDVTRHRNELEILLINDSNVQDEMISFSEEGINNLLAIEELSEDIKEKLTQYQSLQTTYNELQAKLDSNLKSGSSTQFSLAVQWIELNDDIESTQQYIQQLLRVKNTKQINAETKGMIVDINAQVGKVYYGNTPLYQRSIEPTPFIVIDTAGISSDVINSGNVYSLIYDNKVFACKYVQHQIKLGASSTKIYLEPEESFWRFAISPARIKGQSLKVISEVGGAFTDSGYPGTILVKKGDKNYIYIAKSEKGLWGDVYRVRMVEVQVYNYNERNVAISYRPRENEVVLNNWSRPLRDGHRVMQYVD